MQMLFVFQVIVVLSLFSMEASQEAPPAGQGGNGEIELRLEWRQHGRWQPVDVHTVFHSNDEIRFAFKTSSTGYLTVINHATNGQDSILFPRPESLLRGQVKAGVDYVIPGAKASFIVGGEPGFDVTEWVISSAPLNGSRPPPRPEFGTKPNTMTPRCQNEELQSRRSCLDDRAGPASIAHSEDGARYGSLIARDLTFSGKGSSSHISVPDVHQKMIAYEFRIAHR